jgi:hypothetical protein
MTAYIAIASGGCHGYLEANNCCVYQTRHAFCFTMGCPGWQENAL